LRLKLDTSRITATTKITVVAFNDSYLADGEIDPAGNEVKSAPVEITFVKASEVTATTAFDPIVLGASGSGTSAGVTLGDINLALLDTSLVKVIFKRNGVVDSGTAAGTATSFVLADSNLSATADFTGTIAASDVLTAQATISGANSGSAAISGVSAGTKALTLDSDAAVASSKSVNVIPNSTNYDVRSGTTAVAISAKADWTNDDGVTNQSVGAGVTAKVTVSETGISSLAATSSVSAGGKTLKNADVTDTETISYTTTTNADGKVLVDLTATGKKTDAVKVKIEFQSTTGWVNEGGFVTYTWRDAARTADKLIRVGEVHSANLGVKRGGSYTVTYNLVDEFGGLVADTTVAANKRAVRFSAAATNIAIDRTVAFSNGVATATFTDESAAAQNYTLNADLQKRNAGDTAWEDATGGGTHAADIVADVVIYAQSSVTPGFLTIAKSVDKPTRATDSETLVTAQVDTYANGNSSAVVGTGNEVISGVVTSDDGNAAVGVPVTISAAGVQFVAIGSNATADAVKAPGTITVYTTSTGAYSVKAISQKAGKIVITATAGSLSKTTTPEYAAAAATAGSAIAISAPAFVSAGGSATIVVTLTDKFGNPVQTTTNGNERLSVSVTGAGVTGTIPTTTDAAGQLRFSQLLGMGDTGSYVVTVKYDADGASTAKAEISKAATVTIGTAPVVAPATSAAIAGSTKRMFVSVTGNSTAKNVVVKVAGKTVATLKGSAAKKTYTIRATKGSKKVTVFVGGKLIATKTVTVK
jgi:hypothetical protein